MSTLQEYENMNKKNPAVEGQKKKQMNVDIINPETYQKLSSESERTGVSIRKITNNHLDKIFEKEEFMKKYLPQLKIITLTDEGFLYIQDTKFGKTSIIGLNKKGFIHCDICDSTECVHVIRAMAHEDLSRIQPKR